jgi:hypothetical protein
MKQFQYERAVDLLSADIGDELVALDAEGGHCFGFNSVAASVWRLLEVPRTFDQLKSDLMQEYEVSEQQCGSDLAELLDDFVNKRLIRRT